MDMLVEFGKMTQEQYKEYMRREVARLILQQAGDAMERRAYRERKKAKKEA